MSDTNHKTQRLASAVYLLTSFFADREPLKWKLRDLSADLAVERVKDKINISKEILALLSLARNAGLVSDGNFDIVKGELSKFAHEQEKPLNFLFPQEFLDEEKIERSAPPQAQIKDNIPPAPRIEPPQAKPAQKDPSALKDFGAVSVKKSGRQNVIIGLLKRKKEIMIKDVSTLISGCSEKTIQRELQTMVAAGILRKIGEKRWSRYTLA